MRYPINVAATLSGMEPGTYRDLCEVCYQAANDCYQDGRNGAQFMWRSLDAELVTFRGVIGKEPTEHHARLLRAMMDFCREAYQQGQRDRKEATA